MMLSLNSNPLNSSFAGTKLKPITVGPYDSDSIAGMGTL